MIEIPSAKDMRDLTSNNREFLKEKEVYLSNILDLIMHEANRGNHSVYIESEKYYNYEKIPELHSSICDLVEKGYKIKPKKDSETEYGCFGASSVQVLGLLIEW